MAVVTRGSRYCPPAVTGGRPAGFQAAARGLLGFAPPPRSATCRADGSFAKHGGASLVHRCFRAERRGWRGGTEGCLKARQCWPPALVILLRLLLNGYKFSSDL